MALAKKFNVGIMPKMSSDYRNILLCQGIIILYTHYYIKKFKITIKKYHGIAPIKITLRL